ncbi:MAG: helix-turn-helix transcriptional regulator [Treponema sp.]|jgi:transcriptional regulator with XRE-family HTH domain|nr:helix-turn-helix transcriptional regulator [Treponema sp.]
MNKKIDENFIHNLVSSNIKRFRKMRNISQLDLSVITGLTHNFINDIENRKKGISAKSLAKLSNALNVEPYQFFLQEDMCGDNMRSYVKDLNVSFLKAVSDLTELYFPENKKER